MKRLLRTIRRFLSELRRRNVYRVALAYLAAGFVVVELANIAAGAFDLPGWFQPMVWTVCGLGFPIALVIAWAFEVTPEGVRVEEPEGSAQTTHQTTGSSPSNGVITGLLVVAIGLLLYPRVFSSGDQATNHTSPAAPDTTQIDERSIAVLPFEALSKGEESETFARGVHDDLLTRLSNISDLTVISRTSVEKYRDTELSLPAIADSLAVRWVMEGGVLQAGGQIQVNAQLIDPKNDAHVWAADYRRDLTAENLFAIQGEITGEIADALQAELTAGEQERIAGAPTGDLTAYRLYAKGRRALSESDLHQAALQFGKALSRDSTLALAWAGLADVLGGGAFGGSYRPDSLPLPDVSQMEAARRALELAPTLAEAHAALGHAYLEARNTPAALRAARRAVELKPSYAEAHQLLGTVLQLIGRFQDALRHFRLAEKLNPHHMWARNRLFNALQFAGEYQEALAEAREQRRRFGHVGALWGEITALIKLGRHEEAITLAQKQLDQSESDLERLVLLNTLVRGEVRTGDTTEARKYLNAMEQVPLPPEQRREHGWLFVLPNAELGNLDAAFREARRFEAWESVIPSIGLRSLPPSLREHPRYDDLIRNLNRYWGLRPDGSVPEDTDRSSEPQSDA